MRGHLIKMTLVVAAFFLPAIYSQNNGSTAELASNSKIVENQINSLIDEVRKNNPSLRASYHRIASAKTVIGYQKGLDPPLVGVEFFQSPVSTFPNLFKGQGEVDYSIQQMLPFPGKQSAMANVERSRAEMLGSDKNMLEQDLLAQLKASVFGLYFIHRKMRLNAENQDIVKNFIAIAQKQYELGLGKQSDVLRAQTELSLLLDNDISLRWEARSLETGINALRNRPIDTPVPFFPEIEPPELTLAFKDAGELAIRSRPELRSLEYGIAMRNNERKAAARQLLPDFMVKGMYKQMMEMPDYWSLMVGLTLPIAPWSSARYLSLADRAKADLQEAQEQYKNMENLVLSQVRDALFSVQTGRERIDLYKATIIPQAIQTLSASVSAYQAGKQDFFSLVDAERTLLSAQLSYHKAVYDLLEGIARLERAVGMGLPEIKQALLGGTK
jgi:cobalt-zinc-cadmium efflux system outer membrane protein